MLEHVVCRVEGVRLRACGLWANGRVEKVGPSRVITLDLLTILTLKAEAEGWAKERESWQVGSRQG